LDGALMLGAVKMSLLPQSKYFGSQQPILLSERGMFLPQRTRLRPARLLGDHHACGATIADSLRRVPQKIALVAIFCGRVHRIFTINKPMHLLLYAQLAVCGSFFKSSGPHYLSYLP